MSNYLKRLAPKKDDNFEIETFNEIDRDLTDIQASASRYSAMSSRHQVTL